MEELRKDFTEFFCRELLSYDGNAQKFTDNIWGWVVTKIKQAKLDSMKKQDMLKITDIIEECAKTAELYEPDEKPDYITYASRDIRKLKLKYR